MTEVGDRLHFALHHRPWFNYYARAQQPWKKEHTSKFEEGPFVPGMLIYSGLLGSGGASISKFGHLLSETESFEQGADLLTSSS